MQLENLQQTTDVINTKQLEDAYTNVEQNTKVIHALSCLSLRQLPACRSTSTSSGEDISVGFFGGLAAFQGAMVRVACSTR